MVKTVSPKLRPNPFTAYRDPETGKWIVIHPPTVIHSEQVTQLQKVAS